MLWTKRQTDGRAWPLSMLELVLHVTHWDQLLILVFYVFQIGVARCCVALALPGLFPSQKLMDDEIVLSKSVVKPTEFFNPKVSR